MLSFPQPALLLLHFLLSHYAETKPHTSTTISLDGDIWAELLAPGLGPLQISRNHSWIIQISSVGFIIAVDKRVENREDTWLPLWRGHCEVTEHSIHHGPSKYIPSVNFQPFGGR